MTTVIKTIATFTQTFQLPSLDERLPPGEYEVETQLSESLNPFEQSNWKSSVLVRLHPRASHPGLSRTLTVPLAELEHAIAKDKVTGKALSEFFVEEMLSDPMIRLVMQADGVSEADLRLLYALPPRQGAGVHDEKSKPGAVGGCTVQDPSERGSGWRV
jgi:hypothetical protein